MQQVGKGYNDHEVNVLDVDSGVRASIQSIAKYYARDSRFEQLFGTILFSHVKITFTGRVPLLNAMTVERIPAGSRP